MTPAAYHRCTPEQPRLPGGDCKKGSILESPRFLFWDFILDHVDYWIYIHVFVVYFYISFRHRFWDASDIDLEGLWGYFRVHFEVMLVLCLPML